MWSRGAPPPPLPASPLRIVVPFGAGGIADLTARAVGQKLGEQLGQAVVIENKPGAGGVAAGELVARAEPDGHTLLLMSNGTAVSAGLFKAAVRRAEGLRAGLAAGAPSTSRWWCPRTRRCARWPTCWRRRRRQPGKLNIATVHVGSTQNLAAELFKTTAGIDAQVVPFNGTPAVITALRSGEVDAAVEILGPGEVAGHRQGAARAGGAGREAACGLPDVPTAAESGGALCGFNVAPGTRWPRRPARRATVIERLNRELQAALTMPELKQKLAELNVEARRSTPSSWAGLLASEIRRWSDVIARAKIPRQ